MGFPMSYSTAYRWSGNGVVGASSMGTYPPVAVGQPDGGDHTDPEQLFVSAAETCLANTFFFFAGKARLRILSYHSTAEGLLEKAPEGGFRFMEIVIRPVVEVEDGARAKAEQMLDRAHRYCLVSRSMCCPVQVEPEWKASAESPA